MVILLLYEVLNWLLYSKDLQVVVFLELFTFLSIPKC